MVPSPERRRSAAVVTHGGRHDVDALAIRSADPGAKNGGRERRQLSDYKLREPSWTTILSFLPSYESSIGGGLLGFRATPIDVPKTDALVLRVYRVVDALVALDEAAGRADKSRPLAEQIASEHVRLLASFPDAKNLADAAATKAARDAVAFYSESPATTPVQAGNDSEMRVWFFKQAPERRAAMLTEMLAGKHGDLLTALARFAAPAPEAEQARKFVAQRRADADPQRVAALKREEGRAAWAAEVLRTVRDRLDRAAPLIGPSVIVDAPVRAAA